MPRLLSILPRTAWPLSASLDEVRDWIAEMLHSRLPVDCPACGQNVKVYRRRINSGAAQALIAFHDVAGQDWAHGPSVPEVSRVGGEWARLRYFGLIEEELEKRPDGGRSGWWRVTDLGRRYLAGRATVPEYCLFYNQQFLGTEGRDVGISDALGHAFDLRELYT